MPDLQNNHSPYLLRMLQDGSYTKQLECSIPHKSPHPSHLQERHGHKLSYLTSACNQTGALILTITAKKSERAIYKLSLKATGLGPRNNEKLI